MQTKSNSTKKLFRSLGTCSQLFFHLVNREFDNNKKEEERAADPLAGGIYKLGYQCGMLWGAALAVGAEAYRRFDDIDTAIGMAIKATQNIIKSFLEAEESIECYDITSCNWDSKLSMTKYFLTGRFRHCFKLAEEWAPKAIDAAVEGLSLDQSDLPPHSVSCASEVARMMGANDEEIVTVAAFAGGLGLSGNACGALSAVIWFNSLKEIRNNGKSAFKDPNAENTIEAFYSITDYDILCKDITGKHFESVKDHSQFITDGGCRVLIEGLAKL
jgi:hypothetical protein